MEEMFDGHWECLAQFQESKAHNGGTNFWYDINTIDGACPLYCPYRVPEIAHFWVENNVINNRKARPEQEGVERDIRKRWGEAMIRIHIKKIDR